MKYVSSFTTALLTVFLLCFTLAAPSPAQAAEKNNVPILSVDGSGTASGTPDQAIVSIGVSNHAANAAEAQSSNAARSAAIQSALLQLGIPENCIQTRNYFFHPTYSNIRNQENEITGYNVDNTIVVIINDVKMVGSVIDTSLGKGANRVHSLDFSIRNTNKLRKEALQNAIRDARDKADVIASGLGKRIAGIQNVSESVNSIQPRNFNMLMMAKSAGDATPISAGSMELSASVHIDFILSE